MSNKYLIDKSLKLRQDTFKAFIDHGEAHLGGSFSMIEMLLAVHEEVIEPEDKFILSKAHASYPYCIYLREKGFNIPIKTHFELDPENNIHCTTGSLGHGLPISVGMAMARKMQNKQGNIYVLMSDGECQEGTTWESLLIAAKHKLDNLIVMIDFNKVQALSTLEEGLPLDNLAEKFKAFNWHTIEIMDGHSFDEMVPKLQEKNLSGKPCVYICHTIKAKGVKPYEGDPVWHARKVKVEEAKIISKELGLS
ncbi:thiamine pyrophosphate-dependent enzyme [Candidatus Thioglobus sp.]|nr:thiamine pyrophosphate-dependent enzyme [Candidatus Thioglobus sp.]